MNLIRVMLLFLAVLIEFHERGQPWDSQSSLFRDFLLRANRYPTLLFGKGTEAAAQKIVLIEVSTEGIVQTFQRVKCQEINFQCTLYYLLYSSVIMIISSLIFYDSKYCK